MTSSLPPKTEWEALKEAARISSSLCQRLAELHIPNSPFPLPPDVDSLIPQLTLSVPSDTLAPLQTLDIPDHIRHSVYDRIQNLIGELQREYRRSYKNSCLETLRRTNSLDDVGLLHRTYQALMERKCLPMIKSQVAFVLSEVAKYQAPVPENRRPFNNEFTPVLEKYFEFNGYPSAAHRSILAQQSNMFPRQIEVWFQNHRNRAKKEQIPVNRLDSDLPLQMALDQIRSDQHVHRPRLPTPPEETKIDVFNEQKGMLTSPHISLSKPATLLDSSYPSRPPHAYPASRSSHHTDPFPTENGAFKFPPLTWRRTPATTTIVPLAVDMDEFCQTFHLKLNFSDVSRRRGTTPLKQENATQPWHAFTTTFTFRAPLPALVSVPYISSPTLPNTSALLNTATSRPIFGSTSLSLDPATSVPVKVARRKTRPLPKRLPQSRSNSFGSRTWSFSSDTSSMSQTSSSSSNYSSPEPTTPPSLPHAALPTAHYDVQQSDLFDFSHSDLDSNFSFSEFLPSQDFNLASSYSVSDKFPDISCFANPLPDFSHNLEQIFP